MLLLFLFRLEDLPIRLLPPFQLDVGQSVVQECLVQLAKNNNSRDSLNSLIQMLNFKAV